MRRFFCLATIVASAALVSAQARATKTLDIYVVDVEGGNATLFISPSGESLLIDTGNGGMGAVRDAGRIVEAARDAGITQIDHLIITHWHGDHYGGLAELASRIPIRHFIDHGPNIQPNEATDAFLQTTYPALYAKATHTVVKPGDTIPVAGLGVRGRGPSRATRWPFDPARGRRAQFPLRQWPDTRQRRSRGPAVGGHLHHLRQLSHAAYR